MVHEPKLIKLLPVDADSMKQDGAETDNTPMNYEPGEEEALNLIIPKYVCSLIYGAMVEAVIVIIAFLLESPAFRYL